MNILVFGASSAIAQELCRKLLHEYAEPLNFILVGQTKSKLISIENDLLVRGAISVHIVTHDLSKHLKIEELINDHANELDLVVLAHGTLPNQNSIQDDWNKVLEAINVNALSHLAILTKICKLMVDAGHGTIVTISSVAGDRGRKSNYIYGSAKGMVSLFTQGLRNRVCSKGVNIITVKPGFVDTPMTSHIEKSGPLWAKPEIIANDIYNAIQKKKNVVYTPRYWQIIMTVIKLIPEFIFKKMSL